EGAELRSLARRARQGPIEEVEDAEGEDENTRGEPRLTRGEPGRCDRADEADDGQLVRREAEAAERGRDRCREVADALARGGRDQGAGHDAAFSRRSNPRTWRSYSAKVRKAAS